MARTDKDDVVVESGEGRVRVVANADKLGLQDGVEMSAGDFNRHTRPRVTYHWNPPSDWRESVRT